MQRTFYLANGTVESTKLTENFTDTTSQMILAVV